MGHNVGDPYFNDVDIRNFVHMMVPRVEHDHRRSSALMADLVIVESPRKTRNINRVLGPGGVVGASFGHVLGLLQPKRDTRLAERAAPADCPEAGHHWRRKAELGGHRLAVEDCRNATRCRISSICRRAVVVREREPLDQRAGQIEGTAGTRAHPPSRTLALAIDRRHADRIGPRTAGAGLASA